MPGEVILLQDVDKVGLRGEVVVGRARLRPQLPGSAQARGEGDARARGRAREARRPARAPRGREVDQAREIAAVLEKAELRFEVKSGPTGSLFGSVTSTDVADELWRTRKVRVDRRKIDLSEPIKRIGRYEVGVDVFQDVRAEVRTLVVPEGGELPPEEELEAAAAAEAAAAEEAAAASDQAAAELRRCSSEEEADRGRGRDGGRGRTEPDEGDGAGHEPEPARTPSRAERSLRRAVHRC